MQARSAFSGGEQARHAGHLRIGIHPNAAHHVVRGGTDLHGLLSDIDVGELLELVIHARQLLFDVLSRVGKLFFDPGDVKEYAAMRAAAAGLDFAIDAAGDMIAREELRRAPAGFVALRVAPALLRSVGGLRLVQRRDIVEHEAAAFFVAKYAALAAHAFGHQNSANAGRPNHASGMELNKFHILQRRPGVKRE